MSRLYFGLYYEGKEIDVWEISRYLGNLLPENPDKEKFEIKISNTMNIETEQK